MQNTDTAKIEHLELATATDVGRERELNEDTVWGAPLESGADNPWRLSALLLVADGMGGHNAGEVASSLAAQTVREIFSSPQADLAEEDLTGQNLLRRVTESLQYVNRVVHASGDGDGAARPGTTLSVCLVREQEYIVGHVGDSRAYLIRRNDIEQVTQDDSLVGEAVRRGQMTEAEARESQFRNQITQAVGLRPEVNPSVYYGHWRAGDVLLLCSDGLTEYVEAHEMLQHVQSGDSLEQVCESLIALANERGGHDNISVAAARYLSGVSSSGDKTSRKPNTWPPTKAPATVAMTAPVGNETSEDSNRGGSTPATVAPRTSSRKKGVPWLLVAIMCGVLAAGLGLFLGLRQGKKAVIAKAPSNEQDMIVTVPATTPKPPMVERKAQLLFTWQGSGKDETLKGLELQCFGFEIVEFRGGEIKDKNQSRKTYPRLTGKENLKNVHYNKGFVDFDNGEETFREIERGGYFQLYEGKGTKRPIGEKLQKNSLRKGRGVPLQLNKEGQYSIHMTPHDPKVPLLEPTVIFTVRRSRKMDEN